MSDPVYAPLAALLRALRETGAITVRTPFGEGKRIAAETTYHLGGSVILKIDPALTSGDARWRQHRRAVEERLAPLLLLRSWTVSVKRFEGAARGVIALVALVVMVVGARRSEAGLHRLAWLVIPPVIAVVLRYAVRPLVVRLARWGLRRALGASPSDPPV